MSIEIKLINLDIVGSIPVFELSFFFNLKCTVWSTVVFHIDIGFKVCAKKIWFQSYSINELYHYISGQSWIIQIFINQFK